MPNQDQNSLFKKLEVKASDNKIPSKFTFPFSYTPHTLCKIASEELQTYIEEQKHWVHDFGLDTGSSGAGKMFGVLVVKNEANELGYISAFSGEIANQHNLEGFVPPIFDITNKGVSYTKGMLEAAKWNEEIKELKNSNKYKQLSEALKAEQIKTKQDLANFRQEMDKNKAERKDNLRFERLTLSSGDYDKLCVKYSEENELKRLEYEQLTEYLSEKVFVLKDEIASIEYRIESLTGLRDSLNKKIHEDLYKQYNFINKAGKQKNILDLFETTKTSTPPEGAGDCTSPKLLQYAFQNKLTPIAMAQFWWGASPESTIRQHKEYYPACMGKCQPILTHMLEGMEVDENPYHKNRGADQKIEIIYEDAAILVLNKPVNMLSVPGRAVKDSVLSRMKDKYPQASGPMIVHRLDQSTSGIMLIAKTKKAHKRLQKQFIERTVKKSYVAILDGKLNQNNTEGQIDLPLCLDYINRPCQQVNFETGKPAQTKWSIVEQSNGKTRILFSPITGRTHQLRVHAAHKQGLNTSIMGDDLYGKKANRLYLHAATITFIHPTTKKEMSFNSEPDF